MKTLKTILLIISIFLFSSCAIYRDAFINNYDGAGCFNDITPRRGNKFTYVDSLDINKGFDAIVFIHFRIVYSNEQTVKPDEVKGSPELHFGLTNEFVNSNLEVKNDVHRRGLLARWFKYYANGNWIDQNHEKHYESYVMFEAKSKLNIVAIKNVYLRFWGDKWIKVSIDKNFKIEPNRINYLGTLAISLHKTDKYSGKVIHQASLYGSGLTEGYMYNVDKILEYNESDFKKDFKFIEEKYPTIFSNYKDKVLFFKWN